MQTATNPLLPVVPAPRFQETEMQLPKKESQLRVQVSPQILVVLILQQTRQSKTQWPLRILSVNSQPGRKQYISIFLPGPGY